MTLYSFELSKFIIPFFVFLAVLLFCIIIAAILKVVKKKLEILKKNNDLLFQSLSNSNMNLLLYKQKHEFVKEVWVFANKPLEGENLNSHRLVAQQVAENILNGVKYVYFLQNLEHIIEFTPNIMKIRDSYAKTEDQKNKFIQNVKYVTTQQTFCTYSVIHFLKYKNNKEAFVNIKDTVRDDIFVAYNKRDLEALHVKLYKLKHKAEFPLFS